MIAATVHARRAATGVRTLAARRAQGACLAVLFAALMPGAAAAAAEPGRARFKTEPASQEVRKLADWIVDSRDNRGLPFVVVDKTGAKVFVFDADGGLRGAARALLGSATGDDSAPGIGTRPLADIRPEERTTPAGRFVASLGRNLGGGEILWVDYAAAISLHPVLTSNPKENRAGRLATPTPLDNRISFGCINVPGKFYQNTVSPAFRQSDGIVYVLPETRKASELFGSYDVDDPVRVRIAGQPAAAK
jgi:hypothetical protein